MNFWKDKVFLRQIVLLSIPIALQNLITSILNIFDQLMVGWLPENADNCLSAVLLSNQIVFIYQIVLFAACNTANIFVAQYSASGKKERIPRIVGFLLIVGSVICLAGTTLCASAPQFVIDLFDPNPDYAYLAGGFLGVVAYSFIPMAFSTMLNFMMRGIKRMKVGITANVIAVACNICLNYLFMFGGLGIEPMGFMGAAYGTIISRIIEFLIIFGGCVICRYPILAAPRKMFCFEKKFVAQYFKMFFPILCNEVFWVLSTTMFLYVYDKLPSSEVALAAMNIAQSFDKIVSVAMIGLGCAAGVVIGNTIGTGDKEMVKDYAKKSSWFSVVVGLMIGLVTVPSAFFVPSLFTEASVLAKKTATILLLLFAITAVFRSISMMTVVGILRSGGDTTFCAITETLLIWLVSVPLVFLFGLVVKANIYVLFLLTNVSEILKATVFLIRVKRGKWLKFMPNAPEKTPTPTIQTE
jgi:putative MATE family efflux protein